QDPSTRKRALAATAIKNTVSINSSGTNTESSATDTTYTVSPTGSYDYAISGFGAGDKIVGPTGVIPTIADQVSFTDGRVSLQYANAGNVTKIRLSGLTAAHGKLCSWRT
ncbi:hypothetical protein EB118_11295, partial [bacterium]|nr:hypothetical protein [bacterium]